MAASSTTLQILREQLSKMAGGDARLTQQLELLVSLTRNTGYGQSLTSSDTVLDATGTTFSVPLAVGKWFVDFVVMVDVVGGSGADGFSLTNATTATIGAGSLVELADDGTGAVMFTAPNSAPVLLFSGASQTQISVRGFVEVLQAGVFGFSVVQTGAPTSATLLAGSGLTTTIQRGT